MSAERTRGPWLVRDGDIFAATPYADVAVARMERFVRPTDERADANAAFIVRACNAHDALVGALRRIEGLAKVGQLTLLNAEMLERELTGIGNIARAALAAATEPGS